jgi:hypothetical protein
MLLLPKFPRLLCSLLLSSISSFAAGDLAVAQRVVALSGMPEAARAQMRALEAEAKRKNPDLPGSTWEKVEKELYSPKMEEQMSRLWAETYATSELTQIEKFMGTPVGHKFFRNNQTLMPRLAASAALESIQLLDILQTEHPDRFPPDPHKDAQVKQLFEVLQKGALPGAHR